MEHRSVKLRRTGVLTVRNRNSVFDKVQRAGAAPAKRSKYESGSVQTSLWLITYRDAHPDVSRAVIAVLAVAFVDKFVSPFLSSLTTSGWLKPHAANILRSSNSTTILPN